MRLVFAFLSVSLVATGVRAQDVRHEGDPRPIAPGRTHADSLTPTSVHTYALDLAAKQFVYGAVDQKSVDVTVTVVAPDGRSVGTFDRLTRGPEPFRFVTQGAGVYRVEVRPFGRVAGHYEVVVRGVEAVATSREGRIDQWMTGFDAKDAPGAVVGVYEGGKVVFAKAYGMADLTHHVPVTVDTRFNLGSVSKQFTGLAFAMLAARGVLSLDDPVRKYIPELPAFEGEVTLRHLLTHTSGYHEAYGVLELRGTSTDVDLLRREDAVGVVRRQPTLEFPPGSKYQYNSTAYVILAEVVERVTRRPFPAWMAEHVFRPLGMRHTAIEVEVEAVMPGAASSYARAEGGGYRTAFSNRAYYGAADVYTTVGDLAAWLRNYRTAEVGGSGAIRTLTTPFVFTGGDTSAYALGVFVGKERGLRRFQHGGGHAGFSARITYYPDLDAGVAVMSNHPLFDAAATSAAVVDVAFGDRMPPDKATPPEPAPPPGRSAPTPWVPSAMESAAYVGRYYSAEVETVYTVALGGGGLTLAHYRWGEMRLVARSRDTFVTTDPLPLTVSFRRNEEGRVTGFVASTVRTSGIAFDRQQ
jgi:CubicO group peptidase (beta-lactamase class C family)